MALDKFQPYLFVSAGEQSNKFLTPSYSGGIASFQAQRAQDLKGLTVQFGPIQEGTGDPSPENVRPISGRTGMTVTAAGKNLFNMSTLFRVNNNVFRSGFFYIPAGNYIFSRPTADNNLYTWYVRGVETEAYLPFTDLVSGNGTSVSGSFSLTTGTLAYIEFYSNTGISDGAIKDIQIEAGNTATPYTPYVAPTEIPVTWETEAGAIYGGTLDVVSGVLTVTHGYILLDGSQGVRTNGRTAVTQRAFISIDGKAVGTANMQSDRFFVTSSGDVVGKMNGRAASNGIEFYLPLDGTADTDASCKQWFADNNTQLVYELATPQTYQLTPTEVRTIAGYNQVYSDAGPVIDIKF